MQGKQRFRCTRCRRQFIIHYSYQGRDPAARRVKRIKLSRCQVLRFCTDEWKAYRKFIPEMNHWRGQQWTHRIERQNLNFRTHLKRLHRRTISFSKSDEMHEAVIKLYIEQHNGLHHF
jgi:IS1 family transposase